MPNRLHRGASLFVAILFALALISPLRADTVRTTDDRSFEGKIVAKTPTWITIDTVIAGIRAKLTLKTADLAVVHEAPFPPDFFNPPPMAPEPDAAPLTDLDTPYIEVPITGPIGKSVYAEGIASALSYAAARKIHHVVFTIDSTGGDLFETIAVHAALQHRDPSIICHALVRNCAGEAIVIAMSCSTVHLSPGAKLGGRLRSELIAEEKASPPNQVLRGQIAHELGALPGRTANEGYIVRSLIDPRVTFAAWKDPSAPGGINVGASLPPKLKPEDIIFDDRDPRSSIQLTTEQAAALGFPTFKGSAADLGEELKFASWKPESEFGRRAMVRAVAMHPRHAVVIPKGQQFERRVRDNIRQREIADRYLQRFLQKAADIDPVNSDYGVYSRRYNWKTPAKIPAPPPDPAALAVGYLDRSILAMKLLSQLDRDATDLGIARTYTPAEADAYLSDLEAKRGKLK